MPRLSHGLSKSNEMSIWGGMMQRCYNSNATYYKYYGGRGIKVCKRWHTFIDFYNDMGKRPSIKYTLDRIDTNGNYELSNCRWATREQQFNNRRDTHYLSYNGKTLSVRQWSRELKISSSTLHERIKRNWSTEKILSTEALTPEEGGKRSAKACQYLITFKNETRPFREWAKLLGITRQALRYRLYIAKWSLEKALFTPRYY